jgi:DDE superfamily endonuclease
MDHLTNSFHFLLASFRDVFTQPSYQLFLTLMTGWVVSVRHRYVTELIYAGNRVGDGHWSRFHRFFSHSVWSLDDLCLVLTKLLLAAFAPQGIVLLALDDTLCRKRGLNLFGAGMHHDPLLSSKALKLVSWGHNWVVLCLVVRLPAWAPTKTFALPIAFRLYLNLQGNNKGKKKKTAAKQKELDTRSRAPNNKGTKAKPIKKPKTHRTRPELGLELLCWLAAAFPQRVFAVTADSLFGGRSILSHLPSNVHLISRVHPGGVLYEPAPSPAPRTKGRKRKKGQRLSSMVDWANDATPWTVLNFDQFGLHAELSVKIRQGLYYKAGRQRLLTFVLTKDNTGKRPMSIFYSTLLDWDAREILSAYASRWSIEVTFEYGKQLLGFEDPANRLPKAVQRTAPMAMVLVSLITLWFHQHGHPHVQFPTRPWYTRKKEPSFADMLGTLRRLSWTELCEGAVPSDRLKKAALSLLAKMIEFLSRPG